MKVLYIVGVGRSGSTLLERMLGAVPGSVNAGELNAIFSRVATQDQRCGCGEPFSSCPFWTAVGDEAFGGWSSVTARMSQLQPRVVRQRYVPRLVTGLAAAAYLRELDEYLDVHHRLYRAIAAVSGAEVVVDASKSTAQLFALRRIERSRPAGPQPGPRLARRRQLLEQVRDQQAPVAGRAPRWAPTPRTGWRCSGPRCSSSAPCCGRRRPTRHGCATRTWSPVPGPRSSGPCAASACPRRAARSRTSASTASTSTPATVWRAAGPGSPPVASSCSSTTPGAPRLPVGARRVVTAVTLPQLVGYGYVGAERATHGPGRVMADDHRGPAGRARARGRAPAPRFLKPGWPLAVLYLGFPLWWALGLAQLIFFAMAAAMAVILTEQRPLRVPRGFALWLLFLVWMLAGVFLIRANAPGTVPGGGLGRLAGFTVWAGWYVAITIAMLYVANTAREVLDPADRPAAGLDVRGHDRLRRARRAGPDAGVPVADGDGAPAAARRRPTSSAP